MSRLLVTTIAALLAVSTPLIHAQPSAAQAEKLLASAQHKATIDGDLRGAIDDYKKAIAAAGNNRGLVARALLRMAECHQQLGDAAAQVIYEQLLRDYSDQKDAAATARSRLMSTSGRPPEKGDRSVWSGNDADGFGTITADGRYLTFTDWANGAQLALRDLVAGVNYRLTDGGGGTQFSALSRDGKHVAYQWWVPSTAPVGERPDQLRVAKLNGTSLSDVRILVNNAEITSAAPYDWSPDNKWLVVGLTRKDQTNQIALVDAQTGSPRILKSLDWKSPTRIFFSPDGRYIAYDVMAGDDRNERHVFVMAVDGSRESSAVAHPSQNTVMGWSPDGGQLLFASNRSGSFGLWSIGIEDGRPKGTAAILKSDTAASWSLGLTATGSMYIWKYASPVVLRVSAVDLATGRLSPSPSNFEQFIVSRGRPAWSANGDLLAYQSCNTLGAGPCTLWIRSMDNGSQRELKPKLGYFFFPRWSPDGRALLTRGRDLRGRNDGVYRIDTDTGEATLVVTPYSGETQPQWAADGKHMVFRRGASIIERSIAAGTERELARIPTNTPGSIALSPDGRRVAYLGLVAPGRRGLYMMTLDGGEPRLLLDAKAPAVLMDGFDWTADGSALVIAQRRTDKPEMSLWFVPVDGGAARQLDVDVNNWNLLDGFRFDRTGKRVAFVASAGKAGLEIRALENFLPAPAPKTASKR